MTLRAVTLAGLVALLAGCSSSPGQKPNPVEFSGTVLLPNGQPAQGVTLTLLATSSRQTPAAAELNSEGKFSVQLVPGKYTYIFEGKPEALAAIPAKYHHNDAANSIEVPKAGASDLTLQLEN